MHEFAHKHTQVHKGQASEIKMLAFFCVAIRRKVFLEIGGLDERFKIAMFEDDDFALSLHNKGYKILCAEDVFIHHWGNASLSSLSFAEYWNIFNENRRLFEEKWGIKWHPQRYRNELMDQLLAQLADNQSSLAKYIIENEQLIKKQELSLAEKDQIIAKLESEISRLDQDIEIREKTIEKYQAEASQKDKLIEDRDSEIATLIKILDKTNVGKEEALQQIKEILDQNSLLLATKDAVILEKEQQIQAKEAVLNDIYKSNAWKLVKILWRTKVAWRSIRANPSTVNTYFKPRKRKITALERKVMQNLPPIASPLVVDRESLATITSTENAKKRVILATHRFFDFDGHQAYYGGAERYAMELARIVRTLGYQMEVWQCGNTYWERYYHGLKVIGLNTRGNISIFDDLLKTNQIAAQLIIFSPFSIAHAPVNVPSIGISHGIYWDHESFQATESTLDRTIKSLVTSMNAVDQLVSVDTNTINWLRTIAYRISEKCSYIPNFVDLNQFKSTEHKAADKVVVLYPRRLYSPRGFYLVIEIMGELLEQYPQLEFHLVGQADPPEDVRARQFMERYPGRVKYYHLPADQMGEAYQKADISIIPTLHSEGTSLSCLEALASNNAIIATNVGGLTDLIINNYNGLLIEPNAPSLREALIRLIEDPILRQRLAENGRKVAEAFNLERWQGAWRKTLCQFLPEREPLPQIAPKNALAFNYAYGVFWDGVKQRPHHLAFEFARSDIETYWLNPDGRRPDPAPNLHIMDWRDDIYIKRPVFFIYYPFSYEEIKKFDHPILVYDVLDDISIHDNPKDESAGKKARLYHQELIEHADFVIASSQLLYNKIKSLRADVLFVPNGVDLEHFNPDKVQPTPELKRFKRSIIGYHGAIASWFDGKLVADAAKLRPEYDFVLVGPVSDKAVDTTLRSQPNIHLMGMVPYENLPPYVVRFDIGIMPFLVNPLTNAIRPLKVLEYLAMRKPVVATPIEEIQDWPGVRIAASLEEFVSQIDECLTITPIQENPPQILGLLNGSTWSIAAKPIIDAILALPAAKKSLG
ncbi:MAG: hypothetical protein A2W33_07055 [Chloroflexi bacterium RBG_16_52_11]|nr:MAG: hypothetical protein A2W33_07055 [Chloroflexi bacterium RBG_16_52_11]